MSFSPYDPPEADHDARPRAILWYRAYAALMAVVSLGFLGIAVMMAERAQEPAYGPGVAEAQLQVFLLLMLAAVMACFYLFAIFVPLKPWGWTLGLVAIALGMTSCTVVFAIPLLLHWMKPNVKAAFARL